MDTDSAPVPTVLHLNVEEVIDGAWGADRTLLPALSSDGDSPLPEEGDFQAVYRRVYEDFVGRSEFFKSSGTRVSEAVVRLPLFRCPPLVG
ncbi:hypothetical protein [Brevibacterium aurantiacum]|uniref:hypothetical protein n=1 Tax=Brevibacterium aurantiacum TaxID=273384 RepID=UPI0010818039|nr:hypothetical protein [Brevibacterium aurantiacum]